MTLKILGLTIIILAVFVLIMGAVFLRMRKPLSNKLSQMGGIFDFGARVRGLYPPFVEGMCGAYYMRYRLIPGKRVKGIHSSKIEIPVDSQVSWSFAPEDIESGDPKAFGVSLEAFQSLAGMDGFETVKIDKGILTVTFSAENAGGDQELLNVQAVRQRVLALSKLARKLGCMARL